VYADRSKRQAKLRHDGKRRSLGSFNTKEEAAAEYDKAAREQRGSAAVCNFATAEEGEAAAAAVAQPSKPRPRPKSGFYTVSMLPAAIGQLSCAVMAKFATSAHPTPSKEEAAVMYDRASRQQRGSAALCNFATGVEGDAAASIARARSTIHASNGTKKRKRRAAESLQQLAMCCGFNMPVSSAAHSAAPRISVNSKTCCLQLKKLRAFINLL
jgi:hypothetical protein